MSKPSIKIQIICLGADATASLFLKESARYINSVKKQLRSNAFKRDDLEDVFYMVVDPLDVTEDDTRYSFFCEEDIGWNRAAVAGSILNATHPFLGMNCNASPHYAIEALRPVLNKQMGYMTSEMCGVRVFFDFVNSAETQTLIEQLMEGGIANTIVLTPGEQGVTVAVKMGGCMIKPYKPHEAKRASESNFSIRMALVNACLATLSNLIDDNQLNTEDIILQGKSVGLPSKLTNEESGTAISYLKPGEPLLFVCVGTGGTGGAFCKEVIHELLMYPQLSLLMIDGDKVERKNTDRQPFATDEIQKNKALALRDALLADYPALEGRIYAAPQFLDTVEDMELTIKQTGFAGKICVIGCVDNHRARQVMEQYYHAHDTILMLDSANEWSHGEVVVSIKKDGKEVSPLRSVYFPEVLTDHSPSASELSCGAVNESAPQHLVTNLAAATGIFKCLQNLNAQGSVEGGIYYFDTFAYFARWQPVSMEKLAG